jgi:hypothetical protein
MSEVCTRPTCSYDFFPLSLPGNQPWDDFRIGFTDANFIADDDVGGADDHGANREESKPDL